MGLGGHAAVFADFKRFCETDGFAGFFAIPFDEHITRTVSCASRWVGVPGMNSSSWPVPPIGGRSAVKAKLVTKPQRIALAFTSMEWSTVSQETAPLPTLSPSAGSG